MGENW